MSPASGPSADPSTHDLALLPRLDFFRGSPARFGGRGGHKEWQYFLVGFEHGQLLVNLSLMDDLWATGPRHAEVARLTVLVCAREWTGSMERFPEAQVQVTPGRIEARLGPNTLGFDHGHYRLSIESESQALRAELELTPRARPLVVNNHPLSAHEPLSWLVLPRLEAHGQVTLGGQTRAVLGTRAYHDHNWGHPSWGGNYSWEWAHALPSSPHEPWSAVFIRMLDRARTHVRYQSLFVWRGDRLVRVLRNQDLCIRHEGRFQPAHVLRVPPEMALLDPGTAYDLPARIEISARPPQEALQLDFTPRALARVLVPGEEDPRGVTVLNELGGSFTLRGRVDGEPLSLEAEGVFELIRD